MNPTEYQKQSMRTRCPQNEVVTKFTGEENLKRVQVLHGIVGLTGEVGELASAIEKFAWYNQELDVANVIEELGDVLWYIAEICEGLNADLGKIMELNINKLKTRYPDKYTDNNAKEVNRNRQQEMRFIYAEDDGVIYEDA
jgi:NTP pyrophosphatase (non-canonical NTP hydrolase)